MKHCCLQKCSKSKHTIACDVWNCISRGKLARPQQYLPSYQKHILPNVILRASSSSCCPFTLSSRLSGKNSSFSLYHRKALGSIKLSTRTIKHWQGEKNQLHKSNNAEGLHLNPAFFPTKWDRVLFDIQGARYRMLLKKKEELRSLNCRQRVEAGNKETSTYSRLKGLLFCFEQSPKSSS